MIVGIDISKASFDASWGLADTARHECFGYDQASLARLLDVTPQDATYVMEATGTYHSILALTLYEAGRRVSVVNPLVIKRFSQMKLKRAKSDKADAQLVRQYGERHELTLWEPAPENIQELKQAHRWLDDLINERTRLINRQEAHRHNANASRFVSQQMKTQQKQLKTQIKSCEQHLEVLVKKSFSDLYDRLISIPAIGPKTAIELIVVTEGFERFADIKKLSAYVGVSPTTYRSGTSVHGKGHIAKLGAGRMRQLLYICSWTAQKCNRSCMQLHRRLTSRGKPPKAVNIAIAHKLLRQAYAVATTGVVYSENPVQN